MNNETPAYLRNTIRSLRIKLGYTQQEAAELIGISPVTLRVWEKDSSNIPFKKIKKIEEVYHTPQDYIFFGSESAFSEMMKCQNIS
jgi:transcriptional regulator with XRE-family HTH domain